MTGSGVGCKLIVMVVWLSTVCALQAQQADRPAQSPNKRDSLVAEHYARGVELYYEHDDSGEALAEAEEEFAAALRLNPRHAPSLSYLGFIAMDHGERETADSLFEVAVEIDSTCAEARVGRARMHRVRMMWEASYGELRTAVKLAPSSIIARWELVSVLIHGAESPLTDDRREESIPHLEKILELEPEARQAHLELAIIHEHFSRWWEAVKHYREVLRIGQLPEDMDVWVYSVHEDAARCLEKLGKYDEALEHMGLYLASLKEMQYGEEWIIRAEKKIEALKQKANY